MKRLVMGALAGLIATSPMTTLMLILYLRLPWQERFTIPPWKITTQIEKALGLYRPRGPLDRLQRVLAAHFGFGAAAGSLYGLLGSINPWPSLPSGVLFGIVVWLSSYMGWLPLLQLYQPPTQESPRREGIMLAAHLVWGAVLGLLFDQLYGKSAEEKRRRSMEKAYPHEAPFGEKG